MEKWEDNIQTIGKETEFIDTILQMALNRTEWATTRKLVSYSASTK